MLRFVVALLAVSAACAKSRGILDGELTLELQTVLEPYDPLTIEKISDIHIITEHSDLTLSASNVILSEFSKVEVTEFLPAIPSISDKVLLAIKFPKLDVKTDAYVMTGTHSGSEVDGSGSAVMTFNGVRATLRFETESITIIPISMCVKRGTMEVTLSNESIEGNFEGLGDINAHLSEEVAAIVAGIVDFINTNSDAIEDAVNKLICKH